MAKKKKSKSKAQQQNAPPASTTSTSISPLLASKAEDFEQHTMGLSTSKPTPSVNEVGEAVASSNIASTPQIKSQQLSIPTGKTTPAKCSITAKAAVGNLSDAKTLATNSVTTPHSSAAHTPHAINNPSHLSANATKSNSLKSKTSPAEQRRENLLQHKAGHGSNETRRAIPAVAGTKHTTGCPPLNKLLDAYPSAPEFSELKPAPTTPATSANFVPRSANFLSLFPEIQEMLIAVTGDNPAQFQMDQNGNAKIVTRNTDQGVSSIPVPPKWILLVRAHAAYPRGQSVEEADRAMKAYCEIREITKEPDFFQIKTKADGGATIFMSNSDGTLRIGKELSPEIVHAANYATFHMGGTVLSTDSTDSMLASLREGPTHIRFYFDGSCSITSNDLEAKGMRVAVPAELVGMVKNMVSQARGTNNSSVDKILEEALDAWKNFNAFDMSKIIENADGSGTVYFKNKPPLHAPKEIMNCLSQYSIRVSTQPTATGPEIRMTAASDRNQAFMQPPNDRKIATISPTSHAARKTSNSIAGVKLSADPLAVKARLDDLCRSLQASCEDPFCPVPAERAVEFQNLVPPKLVVHKRPEQGTPAGLAKEASQNDSSTCIAPSWVAASAKTGDNVKAGGNVRSTTQCTTAEISGSTSHFLSNKGSSAVPLPNLYRGSMSEFRTKFSEQFELHECETCKNYQNAETCREDFIKNLEATLRLKDKEIEKLTHEKLEALALDDVRSRIRHGAFNKIEACKECGEDPGTIDYQEHIILEGEKKQAEQNALLDMAKLDLKGLQQQIDRQKLATEKSVEEHKAAIGKLQNKLKTSESTHAGLHRKLKDAAANVAAAKEQALTAEKEQEKLRNKLNCQQVVIDDLKKKLKTSNSSNAKVKEDINEAANLKKQLRTSETERTRLDAKVKDNISIITGLKEQLAAYQAERGTLSTELVRLQDYIERSKERHAVQDVETSLLNSQNKTLLETKQELEENLSFLRATSDERCQKIFNLTKKLQEAEDLCETIERQYTAIKNSRGTEIALKEQLAYVECERDDRAEEVLSAQQRLEVCTAQRNRQVKQIQDLEEELDVFRKENGRLENQVMRSPRRSPQKPHHKKTDSIIVDGGVEFHHASKCRQNVEERMSMHQNQVNQKDYQISSLQSTNNNLIQEKTNLEYQLNTSTLAHQGLTAQLHQVVQDLNTVQRTLETHEVATKVTTQINQKLRAEHEGCKNKIIGLEFSNRTLFDRHADMVLALDAMKKEMARPSEKENTKPGKMGHQVAELKELRAKLAALETQKQGIFPPTAAQEKILHDLREKLAELESQRDRLAKSGALQCVADVRMGFLESARFVAGEHESVGLQEDDEVLLRAKFASRKAHGKLDAALFELDLVPQEYAATAAAIFEELYSTSPFDHATWGRKASRLVDCQATLKILLADCEDGFAREQRVEFQEIVEHMTGLSVSMTDRDFDESVEIEELIVRLEGLTDDIVEVALMVE